MPEVWDGILSMLWSGDSMIDTDKYEGHTEGKWNVDAGLLIAKTVLKMIIAIGMKAGLESFKISMEDETNLDFRRNLADTKVKVERTAKRIAKEKPLPELPQEEEGGLMTNPLKEA